MHIERQAPDAGVRGTSRLDLNRARHAPEHGSQDKDDVHGKKLETDQDNLGFVLLEKT
jgi:hypothetical protein